MSEQLTPRRTWLSNQVFRLPGGNEDNDLWLYNDGETLRSTWVPTDEQRKAITAGANLDLIVWGGGHPPVALVLNDRTPIGKPPEPKEDP